MCVKFKGLFLCLYVCVFCGNSACAESLKDVVQKAMQTNPAIASSSAASQAAKQEAAAEKAGYYPDLSTSITAGRVYQDNATSRGVVTTRGAAYSGYGETSIALRQKIFDGFETQNRVGAADLRAQGMNFKLLDTQEQIILRLAQSYIDIARISIALSFLSEQERQIQDYQQRIEKLVKEGVSDQTELEQSRDVLMIVRGAVVEYEGQLENAKAQYREMAGFSPPKQVEFPDSVEPYIDPDIDLTIAKAKQNHPAIRSASFDTSATEHDIQAQIAQQYPDLGAELSYLKSNKRDEIGGKAEDARAVIRLNWDFSLGRRGKSSVRQRQSQHQEAIARKQEIERQIEREIYQAYTNHKTLSRQFGISKQRVKLNEDLLASYKAQFKGSRISLLSLMRAESQLFNAKLTKNDNFFNMISAEYAILASTGNLKSIMLDLGNENEK